MKIKNEKIILDVDTGTDDALAILLAEKSKKFDIQGITTVFGNTNLKQVIKNTVKILNLIKRLDTPVFKGSLKPLTGKGRKGRTQGRDGFCEVYLPLPKQKIKNMMIVDPKKLENLKDKIPKDGVFKFYVISDFERTLTNLFVKGERITPLISILR